MPIPNPGSPTPSDASIGAIQNKAALDAGRNKLKLPKLPQVTESPRISNSFGRGGGAGALSAEAPMTRVTEYPMSFGEFLSSGKWSL